MENIVPKNINLSLASIHDPKLSNKSMFINSPLALYSRRNLSAKYEVKFGSCDFKAQVKAFPNLFRLREIIPCTLQMDCTVKFHYEHIKCNNTQRYKTYRLLINPV